MDAPKWRNRPALIVSGVWRAIDPPAIHWALMITSAANGGWPDDISLVERFAECGLSVPCVIRLAKVTAIDARSAQPLGNLPRDLLDAVMAAIRGHLTQPR